MTHKGGGKRIIVLGAASAIGEATARLHAGEGAAVALAGRNPERLSQIAQDLLARGAAQSLIFPIDLAAVVDPVAEVERMVGALGGPIDVVYLFYGVLGEHKAAETDLAEARRILDVNFTSAALWCMAAATRLEQQRSGTLVAISSVAGDRGRQSNYVYGAAKGGLTTLVQGLAHRLSRANARAIAVKLGFVDTPMTAHVKKGPLLWRTPEQVALKIKAVADRGSRPIVYIPSFWRGIMLLIRATPSVLFHKTQL
jgi:decaprenylphospho-beta-D-erythro-pentofuranosid-2-ulose 2-reductase